MKPVVLITGSAGGIGCAAVHLFKEKGWSVIGVDRKIGRQRESVDKFINEDVSEPDAVHRIIAAVSLKIGSTTP